MVGQCLMSDLLLGQATCSQEQRKRKGEKEARRDRERKRARERERAWGKCACADLKGQPVNKGPPPKKVLWRNSALRVPATPNQTLEP